MLYVLVLTGWTIVYIYYRIYHTYCFVVYDLPLDVKMVVLWLLKCLFFI